MQPIAANQPSFPTGGPTPHAWGSHAPRRHPAPLSYHDLTGLLVGALELRDPSAVRHASGVAEFSTMLATKIGMRPERIEVLRYAASVHDLGKMAISEAILSKPTRLTHAEYLAIQKHTVLGYNLVRTLRLDPMIPAAMLSHHENFDGSGYPQGLKGEAIPLEARVIRVADFFDALTDRRRYRERIVYALPEALDLMLLNRHCFDPDLLAAFVGMMDGRGT
jgi:putative nucleotidyltransferase with HDIG domain